MKRTLFTPAVLAAFAATASAQSSVTVFGVIDVAAQYSDNGGAEPIYSLSPDGNASSRLGFRGVEDLGGGLRAGFWLEGAVAADTGNALASSSSTTCRAPVAPATAPTCTTTTTTTGGHTWQRRATASLFGAFGEIRIGRDYVPTFWSLVDFSPFGYNGVGSPAGTASTLGSGAQTFVRANNTIGYFLPQLGGLYGQAMIAAGEGATGNKYAGARIGYSAGPVNIAGAYGRTYMTGTMADAYTVWNVAGSYKFGVLTLQGYLGQYEYLGREQQQGLIGLLVPMGPGVLKASYIRARGDLGPTGRSQSADQYAAGYVYDVSKRSALYATFAYIDNQGSSAAGTQFSVGNGSLDGFLGGQTSKGLQLGFRHAF